MKNNLKNKKILAREILLFISILVLNGLVFVFFLLRNYYYERKEVSLQSKLSSISVQIDNLPDNAIKKLYDGLKDYFGVNYIINGKIYTLPKIKETRFLEKHPDAKLLPPHAEGFSIPDSSKNFILFGEANMYRTPNGSIVSESELRKHYSERFESLVNDGTLILISPKVNSLSFPLSSNPDNKIMIFPDGSIREVYESDVDVAKSLGARIYSERGIFDYISLGKFKDLLKDSTYRNKFYSTFCTAYDFGTKEIFDSTIDSGLKLSSEVTILQQKLLAEKIVVEDKLNLSENKIKSNKNILNILLWTFIISLLIAYPLRLCFRVVKWSLKTIRKDTSDITNVGEKLYSEIEKDPDYSESLKIAEQEKIKESPPKVVEEINKKENQLHTPQKKLILVGKILLIFLFLFLIFKITEMALEKTPKATTPAKSEIQKKDDALEITKTFHSKYNYSISIPEGYCQISESIKNQITDSILKLQNRKQTKLITEAIFMSCGGDEFPRFHITFLPAENYENVTFRQGIRAMININLATEFEKLKSRFNFIDSVSSSNPVVDYSKQAFLFSASGQLFGQSTKFSYSANILCKKGLISISLHCRYPEQIEAARKDFYSIYNSFQIDPNYRLND